MSTSEVLIVAFHCYPKRPCIDGLLGAVLAMKYCNCDTRIVPYWRTDQSFQRLKQTVEACSLDSTSIMYVDCAPDLEQEVDYLLGIIEHVKVHIVDHHPIKPDSPIKRLRDKNVNFKYTCDEKLCAAQSVITYLLKEKEKAEIEMYNDFISLAHFADYEGVCDTLSGLSRCKEIAESAFNNAIVKCTSDKAVKCFRKILGMGMGLYFILDNITPPDDNWRFLYDPNLTDLDICQQFQKQQEIYLQNAVSTISGENSTVFSEDNAKKFLLLLDDMEKKLLTGKVLKERKIGKNLSDVFICNIDILIYGRSLEPNVRHTLKQRGASYAILNNDATINDKGEESYYVSLRCLSQEGYDARDLVNYIKDVSGTEIGGGHPWASAVVLSPQQRSQFFIKEEFT